MKSASDIPPEVNLVSIPGDGALAVGPSPVRRSGPKYGSAAGGEIGVY